MNAPSTPRRPEILAPAGSREALAAALAAGADAVYFGLDEGFNARARAANFPVAELKDTVRRIHRAGAKAFVTLNTLVFEPELPAVERILRAIADASVDAVIVQDPAVALLARKLCPTLHVHASTQMTVSDPDGAAFAASLGCTRLVAPRELSVTDIRALTAASPIEVEVFIHGALCVSWSGQCLTSEAWGGRSANRGQCAQSCRMPYELVVDGTVRETWDVDYLLSPKDLAGARAVPALRDAGVASLKIEGRQKGPQYVSTAVAGYRRWVDAVARGSESTPEAVDRWNRDLRDMTLSYTRGWSDGFLAGSDHQTLVEGRFPKHRGACIGTVMRVGAKEVVVGQRGDERPWTGALVVDAPRTGAKGTVASPLTGLGGKSDAASGPIPAPIDVVAGMGVVFDDGNPEDKREPGGPIFRVDRRGDMLILGFGTPGPDLTRVRPGQRVWITQDPTLVRATEKIVADTPPEGRLAVRLRVDGAVGRPLHVVATYDDHTVEASGETPLAPSSGRGLTAELLADKLGSFGGTSWRLDGIDVDALPPGLHLPVSELKQIRRSLVAALETAFDERPAHASAPEPVWPTLVGANLGPFRGDEGRLRVVPLCREMAHIEAALDADCREVELDWMELVGLGKAVAFAKDHGLDVHLATLRVTKPGEEAIDARLADLHPAGYLVRHWGGMMRLGRGTTPIHGDFSLNVTNSVTARHLLGRGFTTLTPSHDLDEAQLHALLDGVPANAWTMVLSHRIATFHTEHCTYAHLLSEGRDFRTCGRPCESHRISLRDHHKNDHPVTVDAGCRNTVFDAHRQSAALIAPALVARGVKRWRVEFTRESRDHAAHLIRASQALLRGVIPPDVYLRDTDAVARIGVGDGAMSLIV